MTTRPPDRSVGDAGDVRTTGHDGAGQPVWPSMGIPAEHEHPDELKPVDGDGDGSADQLKPSEEHEGAIEPWSATGPEPSAAPVVTATDRENLARARLGLRSLGARVSASALVWGWAGPLLVTAFAAVLRLINLNHPARLIFDETYYVKQAYSLLTLGYEGEWGEDPNAAFAAGDYSALSTVADYVVHPSVGKWMIAVGIQLFGADNGAGWRFSAAVVGTLSVLIVARLGVRLFGSALLGTTAGLLLAVDGMHLTESRTSLLDIFLSFWVLVGFWCVVRDRERTRAVLAHRAATGPPHAWGPRAGVRWWLLAAGVALGLACGVKWSGTYAVAVLGILVLVWDVTARRALGARLWLDGAVWRGGLPAFVHLVPTAALTYVATWASWFTHGGAYRRQWAADLRASGGELPRAWLPDTLNSWWEYHLVMWQFHNNLDSEHTYEAHPAGWIIQWRPTSFYWPDPAPPPEACGADRCVEAITSLGNPVMWWAAAVALLVLVWLAVRWRDWRAWLVLSGYVAMYLPWFAYAHRTIFTFYAVAFVPYVVLCLTFVLGWATGIVRPPGTGTRSWPGGDEVRRGRWATFVRDDGAADVPASGWLLLGGLVAVILAVSAFYWPVWTGMTVSYDFWRWHMWLPSWI